MSQTSQNKYIRFVATTAIRKVFCVCVCFTVNVIDYYYNSSTTQVSDDIGTFRNQNKIVSNLPVVDKRRLPEASVSLGRRVTKCISKQSLIYNLKISL